MFGCHFIQIYTYKVWYDPIPHRQASCDQIPHILLYQVILKLIIHFIFEGSRPFWWQSHEMPNLFSLQLIFFSKCIILLTDMEVTQTQIFLEWPISSYWKYLVYIVYNKQWGHWNLPFVMTSTICLYHLHWSVPHINQWPLA